MLSRPFWTALGVLWMLTLFVMGMGLIAFLFAWEAWDRLRGRA